MGRKKKQSEKEYIWCYYCDREFDDENTLISHQVARHFKCETCGKKLGTFRGLLSHAKTTHNIDMKAVPHALPGRDNTATDIHGMSGIPEIAVFEYKVKKAKQLGLPIPTREAAVIRNPQQEFAAKLAEKRVHTQMADSIASMSVPGILPTANPFLNGMNGMNGMNGNSGYPVYPGYGTSVNSSVGGSRLVYTRTDISMEEWKALQPQYRYQEWLTAINSTM